MLRTLRVEGFKPYRNAVLNFKPGLNLIMGTSQAGKSALLSAFRLLVENRPLGGKFIHGRKKGEVKVEAEFDDVNFPISITKTVGNGGAVSKTVYSCGGKQFSAVGSKVPDEVVRLLNLSDVNYQAQADDSFLVTSSGGEFSKVIGKFIGVEELAIANMRLNRKLSSVGKDIDGLMDSIRSNGDRRKSFRALSFVMRLVGRLEIVDEKIAGVEADIEWGENYLSTAAKADVEAGKLEGIKDKIGEYLSVSDNVASVTEQISFIEEYQQACNLLEFKTAERDDLRARYIEGIRRLGKCPLCLSTIGDRQVKRIEEEL